MKEAAIWIMAIYSLIQAFVIWYFFVYKQNQIDKKYDKSTGRMG